MVPMKDLLMKLVFVRPVLDVKEGVEVLGKLLRGLVKMEFVIKRSL